MAAGRDVVEQPRASRPSSVRSRTSYAGRMATIIRTARSSDADAVQRIEDDADQLLIDRLHPEVWSPAPLGGARLSHGLDRYGRRVQMGAPLGASRP